VDLERWESASEVRRIVLRGTYGGILKQFLVGRGVIEDDPENSGVMLVLLHKKWESPSMWFDLCIVCKVRCCDEGITSLVRTCAHRIWMF